MVSAVLEARAGNLDFDAALKLLGDVAQPTTRCSVVYDLQSGDIQMALGRDSDRIHQLELDMKDR